MISISNDLRTMLESQVTTMATCWKVTRADNVVMGFTDHDSDIVYGGVTYAARTGFMPTATSATEGLAVPNMDIDGFLDSESITEDDISAGVYNFSTIEIFIVDYTNLAAGRMILQTGEIGKIQRGDNSFTAEIRGLSQQMEQTVGQLYSAKCRATFGDAKCQKSLTSYTWNVEVANYSANSTTIIGLTGATIITGLLTYGNITFPNGETIEIMSHTKVGTTDVIKLFQPLQSVPAVGTDVVVVAGCNKEYATCKNTFSNYLNFRGEPYVPGNNKIYLYATHG